LHLAEWIEYRRAAVVCLDWASTALTAASMPSGLRTRTTSVAIGAPLPSFTIRPTGPERQPPPLYCSPMEGVTPGKKPPAPSVSGRGGLTLRKAKAQSLIEGWNPKIWSEDDYCILDDEQRVGRIYPEVIRGQPKWKWFLQVRLGDSTV